MEPNDLGKKIFFLYPPQVLTEVLEELARLEFEVYLARDHERLRRALAKYPDSILFMDIDERLGDAGWESYARSMRSELPGVGLGVVTLNDDAKQRELYLMDLQVQCGFVVLKLGAAKTSEILAKTLEANEARGRRKYVRATCGPGVGQCNVEIDGLTLRADLTDLSSVGMALRFEGEPSLRVGSVLKDLAISVKGQRLMASGVVVAKRVGPEGPVHVAMFTPASIDEMRRDKLKTLVFKINQASMDRVLETA
jgi:hypothetical protein